MAKRFYDIQSSQRIRSAIWLGLLGLVYFLAILAFLLAGKLFLFMGGHGEAGIVTPGVIATALLLGLMVLGLQVWFARYHAVEGVLEATGAEEPDSEDRYHRRFRNLVDEMAIAAGMGGRVRAVVVPSMALTAFAAEDLSRGAIVGVTEGILARLNRDQMQAVVAHEIAHIREGDAKLTALACGMLAPFVSLADALEALSESDEGPGSDSGPGLSAALVVLMRLVSTTISRERELLADANAVELTRNPLALAEALRKIAYRHHFMGGTVSAYAPIFIVDPTSSQLSEGENWVSRMFSSHPPVAKRLKLLLSMAHADESALRDDGAFPFQEMARTGPDDDGEGWLLRAASGWIGPLTLDQLIHHETFSPDAWITRRDDFAPLPARKDETVYEALRRNLEVGGATPPTNDLKAPEADEGLEKDPDPSKRPATPTRYSSGVCPRCMVRLHMEEYEGAGVERCPNCRGVFVEERRVRRVLARREKQFSREFLDRVKEWQKHHRFRKPDALAARPDDPAGGLRCPRCSMPLARRFYDYQHAVVVDRCYSCNATWYDRDELETLQVLVEALGEQ